MSRPYGDRLDRRGTAQVRRTFVMHFETAPSVVDPSRLRAFVGNQISELITLLPANPYYSGNGAVRLFNEDRPGHEQVGQHRLELDLSGNVEDYFLNVVTGYDPGEEPIQVALSDLGDRWRLALNHPARGTAVVILQKGMTSLGGSVQVNGFAPVPLSESVQGIRVSSIGPEWEGDLIFANGVD
jgi:hypothetical protein